MRLPALACLALFAATCATAQPVYRCGSSYSQQACPGAVAIAADPRTPADAARAGSQAQRDAKLADQLEKQRLAQEARAPKASVMGGQPMPPPKPEAAPVRKLQKGEKQPHFIAVGPRPAKETKTKKKAKKDA